MDKIGYFQSEIPASVESIEITNLITSDYIYQKGVKQIRKAILEEDYIPWNGKQMSIVWIVEVTKSRELCDIINNNENDINNLVYIYINNIVQKISSSDTDTLTKCENSINQIIEQTKNLIPSELDNKNGYIQIPNTIKKIFLNGTSVPSYCYLTKDGINSDNSIEEIHLGSKICSLFSPFYYRSYENLSAMSVHEYYYNKNKRIFYSNSSKVHQNLKLTILLSDPRYELENLKPVYRVGFKTHEKAILFWNQNKNSSDPKIYTDVIQGKIRYCINMDNFRLSKC